MENKHIAIGLLAVILISVIYVSSGSSAVVTARGETSLEVQPDEASIYLNIESRGDDAQTAKDGLTEISDNVLADLVLLGLEREQIQFQSFNVYPEYDWVNGKRVEEGFVARQQVIVETGDFDLVSEIIDVSVDAGALVSYVNFELSDELESEYKADALKLAGEDARKKAEATAEGVGKSLGRLVSVQSEDFNYAPYRAYGGVAEMDIDEDGAAVPSSIVKESYLNIYPEDIEVHATIAVQYKLSRF